MKKIFSLLAVAATAVVMTGCMDMLQALGDVLTDDPMFTCNSTVYDGQSFDVLLVKDYETSFSAKPSGTVTFGKMDKTNKRIVFTFNYTADGKSAQEIEVTATCMDADYIAQVKKEKDKDVEPYKSTINIMPWKLTLWKVASDGTTTEEIEESKGKFTITGTSSTEATYMLKMSQAILTKKDANDLVGEYKIIPSIDYGVYNKEVTKHDIVWNVGSGDVTTKETTQTFTMKKGQSKTVFAKLGEKKISYTVVAQ